jgi:hypothetical protein
MRPSSWGGFLTPRLLNETLPVSDEGHFYRITFVEGKEVKCDNIPAAAN